MQQQQKSKKVKITKSFAYPGKDEHGNNVMLAALAGDELLLMPKQLRGGEGCFEVIPRIEKPASKEK